MQLFIVQGPSQWDAVPGPLRHESQHFFGKVLRVLKVGQRAGVKYGELPISLCCKACLASVVNKITAHAVAHPDRQAQLVVDRGDVGAEHLR